MSDLCPVAAPVNAMNQEDQPKTIGGCLVRLLKSKILCDVIFTFPNLPDRIHAHEVILVARSPVFEQIFRMRRSGNVEGNEIEIGECTPERFQQFLEFIYDDKFQVDMSGALDLLLLSQKYKIQPLTEKCEELLQIEIPIKDSAKVFEAASHHGRRELKERAGEIMIKSFLELVGTGAMLNIEEETLVYLLECDELAVKEVGLFQFILDWGRNQVGSSADEELLRSKLKNLISKIRYTNMEPTEFTKVVVPTGLLTAEESLSVYSFLNANEITRGDLKITFNTSSRKGEPRAVVSRFLHFDVGQSWAENRFPGFSKHCLSFKVDRTQVDGQVPPDYFLKKTAITKVHIWAPKVNLKQDQYMHHHILNLIVSIGDNSGPVQEGSFTIRFQKNLWNWQQLGWNEVSVEPPLELMFGRTYSVIIENFSTVDSFSTGTASTRAYRGPAQGPRVSNINREEHVDLEEVHLTLKEIHRKTDYYMDAQNLPDFSEELLLIRGVEIGLQ